MTLVHLRDVRLCPAHHSAIVRLDDASGTMTITFAADSHETVRLGRVVHHGPQACHPIFDFVRALLSSLEAGVTRVVLEDVQGEGISGVVYVGTGGSELPVPALSAGRHRAGAARGHPDLRHAGRARPRRALADAASRRRQRVARARASGRLPTALRPGLTKRSGEHREVYRPSR